METLAKYEVVLSHNPTAVGIRSLSLCHCWGRAFVQSY